MKIPQFNDIKTITKPLLFSGVNKNEIIEDSEIVDGANLDTINAPAITPRLPMVSYITLDNPSQYGVINTSAYYIENNIFCINGSEIIALTSGRKSIVDFNGYIVIFPDKKFINQDTLETGSFTAPDIDYVTVHYNRIFGVKDNYVHASKVGDFRVWDEFNGTEMDSWSADVYSEGVFTAITTYQDHVIMFKRNEMYELYGYTPSQFKILEGSKIGCVDGNSIAEVRGILFFASESGIQTYSGGFPRDISEKLKVTNITKATAMEYKGDYYINIENKTYKYDLEKTIWCPYADFGVIDFAKFENKATLLATNNTIYELESGDSVVKWNLTTKNYDAGVFNKKYIKRVKLKARLGKGSEIRVYIAYDEREFNLVKQVKNTDKYHIDHRDINIVLPVRRCSNYQLKIIGLGDAVIYGEREFAIGSDR